ncbi:UNVERIFIED_ORG: hypothetical protein J2X79_004382 [Arthrobacter globiformis]|nr:hypothetical protein [Arthrobacter globiformis]
MTNISDTPTPTTTPIGIEDLDLTPEGLSDTPAHQQDAESIVHTGNS